MSTEKKTFAHETKGQKFAKQFLAFTLFLLITLLSLTVCIKSSFVSADSITKVFSNEQYVSALRDDILDYTHEELIRNMLPEDCLDEVINYKAVYDISYAYAAGTVAATEDYSETAYEGLIDTLGDSIRETVNSVIETQKLPVDELQQADGAAGFTERLKTHITRTVKKPYMNRVADVVKIGNTATLIGAIVLAVLIVLLVLILISIGSRRYRAVRCITHALNASALLELLLVGGVYLVEKTKTLYIFPTYFRASVMDYVHGCTNTVLLSAAALLFTGLIVTIITWRMKKESK